MSDFKLIYGSEGCYACLKGTTYSCDVRLPAGKSVVEGLRQRLEEAREEQTRLTMRIGRMNEMLWHAQQLPSPLPTNRPLK